MAEFPFNPFDIIDFKKRYKRIKKGLPIEGEDDIILDYRKRKVVETHIVVAPWKYVFTLAFINAFLVSVVKLSWYMAFGKPQVFLADERIKAEIVISGDIDPTK